MIKKTLVYLMLGIMLAFVNQTAIAKEETADTIYHFIFKLQNDISNSDNEVIMDAFRTKMDVLGIDRCSINRDRDMFIVTAKTHIKPEDIVAEIQSAKFPVPLTFETSFVCDVAKNKEHFIGEFTSTEIQSNSARDTVGGIVVEPQKMDYKDYIPEE